LEQKEEPPTQQGACVKLVATGTTGMWWICNRNFLAFWATELQSFENSATGSNSEMSKRAACLIRYNHLPPI
jgi:hypothetical protein